MTYTNEQRQAIANIFKKVRSRMQRTPPWVGPKHKNSRYICDHIADTCHNDELDKRLAGQVIRERIEHKFSVEYWLVDAGHINASFANEARYGDPKSFETRQMHAYRLRWLESLIAEFSTKEKQS
jgi:hypothetical protein